MDNLPNNPSGGNSNPPPFGSNFTPHTNPPDPNNPYQPLPPQQPSQTPNIPASNPPASPIQRGEPDNPEEIKHEHYSEAAEHKIRDDHGRFLHIPGTYTSPTVPAQTSPASPTGGPTAPGNPSSFSERIKSIWHFFSKNYKKIGTIAAFVYLVAMNSSFQSFVAQYFPNSSPILSRAVSMQGLLKTSETGIYTLVLPDQSSYILHFKPTAALTNLKKLNEVVVKGNLTWTPYTIENAEIYPLNISTPEESDSAGTNSSVTALTASATPDSSILPKLYSDIKWETDQKKLLLFTSGKRRIEQEGVYLESVQMTEIPQAFLDYYTNQLTNLGFKQTLDSSEPTGTTITFAKEDSFFTFGVKNVFQGSGENKKIVGYKAFLEHN